MVNALGDDPIRVREAFFELALDALEIGKDLVDFVKFVLSGWTGWFFLIR